MSDVLILGAGVAGLSAAAALAELGCPVTLIEGRPYAGGRATSYAAPGASPGEGEIIDNCQHILLRCCVNLQAFYRRMGVEDGIEFHREFTFIEPGGRRSRMKAGRLPAPLHFAESFAALSFLSLADKFAIARAMLAIRSQHATRADLDRITMLDWLREQRQTPRAIERFWRQVLVSAVNEELDRMAASHGLQVFWLGFLASSNSYEMGVPRVPLGELYSAERWARWPNVELRLRAPATRVRVERGQVAGVEVNGEWLTARHYISALPYDRLAALPDIGATLGIDYAAFEPVPIAGIHLWFDRAVTELPHGTLLDRTLQWFYAKQGGRYLQLVVSASRSLTAMPRDEVIALALRELAEFLPAVRKAALVKAHVVKEQRATFSARPGLDAARPACATSYANFSLAGDWTRTGWPATMEGAARSGHAAAERAARELGYAAVRCLLPDIA
jgi:zeta-carotene desaturase